MVHAGMNTFCTELWQRRLLLVRGGPGDGMRDTMAKMIARGDQWTQLHAQSKGITWTTAEDGTVEIDQLSFINAMMQNPDFYEAFGEQSFEARMENQIYRINTLCDTYPGLSSAVGIPMFVDLPMSAAINNYNDLVDEVVTITRSRAITTDSWYYSYFVESVGLFNETHTTSDRIAFLERTDKYFDSLRVTPDAELNNSGLIGEYATKIDDYLLSKVSTTILALQKEKMIIA